MDHNGLLHYQGRKDHQIKLHGQRIELGEIEQCLLNTSISACVVIKWDDDNLIVYVQSSNINEEQLRQHCQCHLPPYMIPSLFIILDKLPLNANGKIDRKLLPSPSSYFFNHLQRNHTSNLQMKKPHDEIQITLHTLWCDMFQQKQISIDTNIFTIGGHSLLLMQLYRRYQTTFHLETKSLSINDLFQYPTIIDHSQFIRQAINIEKHFEDCWSSLHLIQAPASFAQERIFLDEQIRFSSRTNNVIYTIPLLYRVASVNSHISITRLHHALQFVIMKHSILRTALHIDSNGIIMQYCLNININNNDIKPYGFSIINLHDDKDSNIDKTITEMMNNSDLFDLTKGCVIHCHILRQYHPDDNLSFKNDDLLTKDDLILFNIHHSAFDGASTSIFLRDFSVAYETDCSLPSDDDALQYIDYSIYEHQMDMTLSRNFWQAQLQAYNLEYRLSLSTDRHRSSTHQRSGLASVAKISFDDQISIAFLNYASTHKITPFQLGLATFYAFLFKLTHGQSDLCITCLNANRYKSELENMIGMFVATLPYRIQLNSRWSFDELVKHVRDRCTAVEQEMPMTAASIFWLETLYDCRLDRSLQLPFDRYRLSDEHRTGRGISFSFEFGEELSRVFLSYSSSNDITLAHMALACYYAFLFKLTNGESDLCIGMNTDGRYKEELMSVIGMFVNAIPLRCQLDPHWSFHQLVEDVRDIARNSLKYSYFPLQRILAQHPNATKPAFLETLFEFRSYTSKNRKNKVMIGNAQLIAAPFSIKIGEDEIMSKFDFILTIQHDLDTNQLSYTINASLDLFDRKTVDIIAQRFHSMLEQLFDTEDAPTNKPIYELPLILADEKLLMKSMNNTQVLSPSVTCIHHRFVHQVMKYPQKLAVELDDQSLTYCELLYYSQALSWNFLNEQRVNVGEIVCQCVERSLSMVIGMMAIEMAGGVYCPLSPRDPQHRLHGLVEQTHSRLVLVHHLTKKKFNDSEAFPVKLVNLLRSMVTPTCQIWNLYGPAETTIDCTFHLVQVAADQERIAIGVRLPNYRCMILDEFSESVLMDQEGELLVGGIGVFAGYLGRDDLTTRARIVIDSEIFYRTGDLVRMDSNGLLHYQGRKDYQIKLHGQRIELGEIEQCLLNTLISACVVIKWDDDHLIAYVQSSNMDEEQLRKHCQSHLPPHMIPSLFIVLDKLPLNVNGKIDRKLLPSPSSYFSNPLQLNHTNNLQVEKPHNEIEITLHIVWCDMLQQKQISIDTNIFTIGGHSLLLMQLYHRYQTTFHLETKHLSINDLFQYPTIIDHAQFIRQALNIEKHFEVCWSSLHLIQAPASFAQERIVLDEQIRFSSKSNNGIYTIPLLYRVSSVNSHISITRLHHALQFVIMKHSILRTALHIDSNGIIMQYCLNMNIDNNNIKPYGFSIINLHDEKNRNIDRTITEIINNSDLFDLTKGCVIHCHILRQYHPDDNLSFKNDDLLTKDDLILFNIHHSAFDGASTSIFLRDFSLAYATGCSLPSDDDALQYIDYSIYEHQMDMTLSRNFWQAQLQAYNLE
ncbi:unnamed protein product, partial [Rotaria sordida]